MLLGLGIAFAHEVSSPIHPASSRRIGAPCAAKMTGIRPPDGFRSLSFRVVTVSSSRREHEATMIGRAPNARSMSLRLIVYARSKTNTSASSVAPISNRASSLSR